MDHKERRHIIQNIITPFDMAFISAIFLSVLLILISSRISSITLIFCLYINVVIVMCVIVFFYGRADDFMNQIVLLSVFSGISYPVSERILGYFIDWGTYIGPPPYVLETPIYVILYWMYLVFCLGYLYKKLLLVFNNRLFCSALVGVCAFIGAILFENWGNSVGLWVNNHSDPMIGVVPLYVLLGYLFVFSSIRYLVERPVWGGIICSPLICAVWLGLFYLLRITSG